MCIGYAARACLCVREEAGPEASAQPGEPAQELIWKLSIASAGSLGHEAWVVPAHFHRYFPREINRGDISLYNNDKNNNN